MAIPLLVDLYEHLPPLQPGDDEELWAAGVQQGMKDFRASVREKYNEGTLQRLLKSDDVKTRRAAVLALGLIGTMQSNAALAAMLRDEDTLVVRFSADSLWEVWFRGGTADQNWHLQQAVRQPDPEKTRAALDSLIQEAPDYAELYNQRAIWFFRKGEYTRAVEDCETVLRLNPYHFGAAAGMGQCHLKLKKHRSALRDFQQALEINPSLEHLRDTIQNLEEALDKGTREGE